MFWAAKCVQLLRSKVFQRVKCSLVQSVPQPLKGAKKFGSKVFSRQFFHGKTVFHMKILFIIHFTNKLQSIKDYFVNGPQ